MSGLDAISVLFGHMMMIAIVNYCYFQCAIFPRPSPVQIAGAAQHSPMLWHIYNLIHATSIHYHHHFNRNSFIVEFLINNIAVIL